MVTDRISQSDVPPLDAALVESAHVARKLAVEHCPRAIGGDCTWYHGVWQYLRALGLLKNAGGHAAFLHDTLRSLAEQNGARRVLVSGSANDAMALLVITAFRDAGAPLELTIIDRCETPLALSRWSAARVGAESTTRCGDILDFTTEPSFDVITTNSFLSYIEPAARPRLFARWASLLRRGGKLLFTNRLRPAAPGETQGFTPDQAQMLCAAAHSAAERHRDALGLDPALLEDWVREYAARIKPFPLRSTDEVLALLDDAGFAPDRVDTALFPGMSGGAAIAGPTLADRADFVRVLATRR
jgi:SAM-dependent methyltransferase